MESRFRSTQPCAIATGWNSTGRCGPIRKKSGGRAPRRGARRDEALVAGLGRVGARPRLLLLDLRILEIVTFALRVHARDAPADLVLREALPGIAAALSLSLSLGRFLLGFLRGLCLILLALAKRLLLLRRGLGRGVLGRVCGLV